MAGVPAKRRKRLVGKCAMIRQLLKQTMILNYPYSFAFRGDFLLEGPSMLTACRKTEKTFSRLA